VPLPVATIAVVTELAGETLTTVAPVIGPRVAPSVSITETIWPSPVLATFGTATGTWPTTVIVTVPGADVPPGPVAVKVKLSVPA